MSFGESVSTCFRKYAVFSGRATRPEYWYWVLFIYLLYIPLFFWGFSTSQLATWGTDAEFSSGVAAVIGVVGLALLLPSWGVLVRRLHDTGHSGWFVLIALIPLAGGIILLVTLATDGTRGPNRYGPDPKRRASGHGFGGDSPTEPWPSVPLRKCPFCAEFIQPDAIVCRYCGRDLTTPFSNV